MREFDLSELGYFSAGTIHRIAAKLDGKTYMHFKVGYCNEAGNCTLIIMTDYAKATELEIKRFFLHAVLEALAD